MPKRLLLLCLVTVAPAYAQSTPPTQQQYTLVQQHSLFGPDTTMTVYRDGSKAAMDIVHPTTHTRTVLDLQAQTNISWDAGQPTPECGNGTFKGDWGDPFVMSAGLVEDLNKQLPPRSASRL